MSTISHSASVSAVPLSGGEGTISQRDIRGEVPRDAMTHRLFKKLCTCGLALLLLACGGEKNAGQQAGQRPPPSVKTAASTEKQLTFYENYPATVRALESVEVRPQVTGYITGIHFKEGDYVRKGQRLYTVDVRRYVADVDQARSRVASAEANLELSEKNVARYRRLAESEAIALQTLDQAEAEVEARRQEVESARAGVRSARTQLDYTVIRAPLSGLTSLNSAKAGTQVSPGNPLLTTISQEEPIGVDFSLPQQYIPRLARLTREGGGGDRDSTFRLLLPNGEIYNDFGTVYASDREVDPRTGTLNVRLQFENPDDMLRSGMSLEVQLLNEQSGKQVVVPTVALGEQMGEYYVFEVQDSMALRRKVEIGRRIRDEVIIREGLEAGKTVITEGLKNVKDSSTVKIVPTKSK